MGSGTHLISHPSPRGRELVTHDADAGLRRAVLKRLTLEERLVATAYAPNSVHRGL